MKYDVKVQFLSTFLMLILIFNVKADIPVHCLKSQIVGSWTLFTTEAQEKTIPDLYQHNCGHKLPSHESTALNFNMDINLFSNKYVIDLKASDEAIMKSYNDQNKNKNGKWTMVYDEGFDITFDSIEKSKTENFFVFSKYTLNDKKNPEIKSKWASHCYSTLIGWYSIGNNWGCFYAKRNDVANPEVVTNGEAENKLNVLENQISSKDEENNNNSSNNENRTFSTVNIFFEKQESRSITEPDIVDNISNESNFLESKANSRNKLTLTAEFRDHSKFVERINSMNKMWKAENYDNFSSMTLGELNSFAGRKRNKNSKMSLFSGRDIYFNDFENASASEASEKNEDLNYPNRFLENSSKKLKGNNKLKSNESSDVLIPEEFLDYKKFMSIPRSQGNCGSCFAASTLTMLEARIRKHYPDLIKKYFSNPNDFALSLKHVLECSVYNQGCDGGYSYLVSKFYKEFEMIVKDCYSSGCKKSCKNPNMEDLTFSISNFGYVGGSYGKCDEKQIMKEVYTNGPIVLSLEPDYSFMFYRSGVYQSPITSWITQKTKRPEWEKVDHSMVLVGWGVENINGKKVKYWLLQNSWGSAWGENGFMKFIRGIDHLGIESICEYGMPVPKTIKK